MADAASTAAGAPAIAQRDGPATAKRAQVEAAVLAATEALLAQGSTYADLNIERIATAAGISRTAFYFYFSGKRDLLMRLAAGVSEQLFRQGDVWFSGRGDPAVELRQALTSIAAVYREHGVLIRAVVEVSTYEEDIAVFWRGLVERFVTATASRLAVEQHGALDDEVARASAFALTWMVERTFYQQLVQQNPIEPEALIDALVRIHVGAAA